MDVSLYRFAKKSNSTATPSAAPLAEYDCKFKAGTSVLSPSIGLNIGATTNPASYNYAFIEGFNRWYYINDWVWEDGLWWANMAVDPLASYKTYILNTSEYVMRATKAYDGSIVDGFFPTTAKITGSWVSEWDSPTYTPWARSYPEGFYVLGIINNDSNAVGAVSYYAFNAGQFGALKNYLLGSDDWTGILGTNPDFGENLYKSLFNPYQYIATANWFPLNWNNAWGTPVTTLPFGWWTLTSKNDVPLCYRLNQYTYSFSRLLSAGEHPQARARGMYVNAPPFTIYRLFAPPWGEFELDGGMIANGAWTQSDTTRVVNLSCAIQVDFVSGNGHLIVTMYAGDGENLTLLNTQALVAVPIQLAQINSNGWGEVRSYVNAGTSALAGALSGNIIGAVSGAANGILDAFECRVPHVQTQGNNGGIGVYQTRFQLENIFYTIADDAIEDVGRPLCKTVQLGNLIGGYVQTADSHIPIPATEAEITAVNDALNRGVYLE